jgi:Aminotransferase class-V
MLPTKPPNAHLAASRFAPSSVVPVPPEKPSLLYEKYATTDGGCHYAPPHRAGSVIEHPAVMEPAHELQRRGWRLRVVPVDREGRLQLDALLALLAGNDTALVSVMHANNELGTVQPVEEVGRLVKQ